MKSKSNPTKVVKVPHDSYSKANERGVLNDYLFYIQLKNLSVSGYLKRGNTIPLIRAKYSISESQIRHKLARLINLGYVTKEKGNYWLVSYDKIWTKLGIQFKANGQVKNNLFKIYPGELNDLIGHISFNELKLNYKKQYSQTYKNYFLDPFFKNDTDKKNCKELDKCSFIEKKYKSIPVVQLIRKGERDQFSTAYELNKDGERSNKSCNLDVTISCLGLARIMGYDNAMNGYYLEQRMKRLKLITVESRKVVISALSSYEEFKKLKLSPAYLYSEGIVYKQLPNKVILL